MQPLIYSVQDMLDSGVGRWQRSGFSIGYYKNQFIRNASVAGGRKGCTYYTLTFSLVFTHTDDIVYVAYHYPFSYSMLQVSFVDLLDCLVALKFISKLLVVMVLILECTCSMKSI